MYMRTLLVIVASLLMAASAAAQPRTPGRRPPGQGAPPFQFDEREENDENERGERDDDDDDEDGEHREGPNELMPRGASAILIIQDPIIQKQLRVEPEQQEKIDELLDKVGAEVFVRRDEKGMEKERKLRLELANLESDLGEVLQPPQMARLQQLALQVRGFSALLDPKIAPMLRISPDQSEQIARVLDQSRQEQGEMMEMMRAGESPQTIMRAQQQIERREENSIRLIISAQQIQEYNAMLGPRYNVSRIRPFLMRAPELSDISEWRNSEPLKLADLRGQVVLVHFFSTGCEDCEKNFKYYETWQKELEKGGLKVIGIQVPGDKAGQETAKEGATAEDAQPTTETGPTFPIGLDKAKRNAAAWANSVLPSVYIVDKEGYIREWWYGPLQRDNFKVDQMMKQLLQQLMNEQQGRPPGRAPAPGRNSQGPAGGPSGPRPNAPGMPGGRGPAR